MTNSSRISGSWLRVPPLMVAGWVLFGCVGARATSPAQSDLPEELRGGFEAGVAAEKAGRLDEAEKDFQQVLRRGGKVAFVYNNLGIVYQRRGDHVRAIEQFREAIRLQPDYAAPHARIGAGLPPPGRASEAGR